MATYRTAPDPNQAGMPTGIPYIIGNEAAERFSFYGMRTILYVFMTEHLLGMNGELAVMDPTEATIWQHNYMKVAYAFPIFGAILCDWGLGKYRTILGISLLYCVGHTVMALVDLPGTTGIDPRTALFLALALIAFGAGGIKPCVSAHLGDQFGPSNKSLLSRAFGWYYCAINLGSVASTLLTPWLLSHYGPAVAFGVPGVLMALATLTFWLGRNEFVHVPPGGKKFLRETFSREGMLAVANLLPMYLFISAFWCLFDQTTSTWVEQAKHMDRVVLGYEIDPSAHQAANPIFILLLFPLFSYAVYPAIERVVRLTPLRKVGIGMVIATLSFALVTLIQQWIDAGQAPHLGWQTLAYFLITSAEILVSITTLEFSYTQAPVKMKSFVTGVYWLSVYLGNEVVVQVNEYIHAQKEAGVEVLQGASYFRFFTIFAAVAAVACIVWSSFYRGQTYLQGEDGEAVIAE